jgi:hypothetical protein
MSTRTRPTVVLATAAAVVVLAACGADDPATEDTGVDTDETDAPTLDDEEDDGFDDDLFDDGDGDEPAEADPADDASDEDSTARSDDETDLLDVEATTDIAEREALDARLIVTDVRVGAHDGFDRVVIEFEGEGEAGWFIDPTDDPLAQGSGLPIEVDADHTLLAAVSTVVLPGDEPDSVDPDARFDTEVVEGTGDGPVIEVVRDTLFEGIETFAIGLDEARPYRVERFADPERIVIDIESS